jgi:hypothetical protein
MLLRFYQATFKPVFAGIIILAALAIITPEAASAQIDGDTLWATGVLLTKNANNGSYVGNVNVRMRPETVQMYTPDTVFNYVTDGIGVAPFNVIAYVDSTTGTTENNFSKNTKAWVYDNTLNIKLPENVEQGEISIFAINGQKVGEYKISGNKISYSITNLANTMYIFRINTPQGNYSNKFTKFGVGTKKETGKDIGHKGTRWHNTVKKVVTPTLATATVLTALTFITPNQASAQIKGDTLWATGMLVAENSDNGNGVSADIIMRPETVQMYTPDTVFNYITDGNGLGPFEVIAYIDSTTGIRERDFSKNTKTWVWNNRLHIELPENIKKGEITLYDMAGKKTGRQTITSNKTSVSLAQLDNAVYVLQINTPGGKASRKFTKTGVEAGTGRQKSEPLYTATYWVRWEKNGFRTDSMLVSLQDGENDPIFIQMTPDGGGEIPQYQWITGYTKDENASPLSGTLVEIYNRSNNQLLGSTTTNSAGKFEFNSPVSAGIDVYFKVDKDDLIFYAYDGSVNDYDSYEVPDEITSYSDTLTDKLRFVMYEKLRQVGSTGTYVTVPGDQVREMLGGSGNIEPAIHTLKFYLGSSMSNTQKQGYRNNTQTLEDDINVQGLFEESSTLLNQGSNYDPYNPQFDVGINVEQGSNTTLPDYVEVTTPLGNVLTPVFKSDMTLVDANYLEFVHEHGRALGFQEVGYLSIMRDDSPVFTDNDMVMYALGLLSAYKVYNSGESYFGLSSIVDSLSSRTERFK